MPELILEKVGPENLARCGIGCVADPRHPGRSAKLRWLRERFEEGLRLLLFRDGRGRPLGFLECVPGEHAWRPVDARGWLFVHCLWVYPRGQAVTGLGSLLIRACVEEARRSGAAGVAAVVSAGPWMAGRQVFLKNGFAPVAKKGRFDLVTLRLKRGPDPRFREISGRWRRQRGLQVVYAPQCPFLPKSVREVTALAKEHGLATSVTVLESAAEAQDAPSSYGVFSLLWNGRLLSDHYVSAARFRNLLRKEILGRGR